MYSQVFLSLAEQCDPVNDVDKRMTTFGQDLSAVAVAMLPEKDLPDYFTSPPPLNIVHIIVELPSSTSSRRTQRSHKEYSFPEGFSNLSFQPTPLKSRDELDGIITAFLTRCRPHMRELVENADNLPSFLPR